MGGADVADTKLILTVCARARAEIQQIIENNAQARITRHNYYGIAVPQYDRTRTRSMTSIRVTNINYGIKRWPYKEMNRSGILHMYSTIKYKQIYSDTIMQCFYTGELLCKVHEAKISHDKILPWKWAWCWG